MKFIILLLAVFASPGFASEALNFSNKFLDKDKTHVANNIDDQNAEIIKTVITKGYGTSIDAAALNAAEDALSQIIGSFIDSETIIKRKKEIKEGIIDSLKIISKDIRNYSQGSIKYFEILDIKNNGIVFIVEAKVGVRVEDFKTYIKELAFEQKNIETINLFAEMQSKENNLENKYDLLKKVIHPIEKGEVTEITIGELMSFNNFIESGKCEEAFSNYYLLEAGRLYRNYDFCSKNHWKWNKYKMNPDKTVIFNFSLKIKDNYLDNIYNTLDNISDHKGIIPHNIDYFNKNFNNQIKFKSNTNSDKDIALIVRDYRSKAPLNSFSSSKYDEEVIKTVIATGFGSNLNEAVLNGAQDALKQVVGSFVDSEILIKKETVINNSLTNRTKNIKKDITNYSQGSIKHFELLDTKKNGSIFVVKARADVRVEDFKEYIKNSTSSRKQYGANNIFYLLKGIKSNLVKENPPKYYGGEPIPTFDFKCFTKTDLQIIFLNNKDEPIKSFTQNCSNAKSGGSGMYKEPAINKMLGPYRNLIFEEFFHNYASTGDTYHEKNLKEHKLSQLRRHYVPIDHFHIISERRFWVAFQIEDLSELTDFKEIQIKFVK